MKKFIVLGVFLLTTAAEAKFWTHQNSCPGSSHNCTDAQALNSTVLNCNGCICCSYTNNPKEKVVWVRPGTKGSPVKMDTKKLD